MSVLYELDTENLRISGLLRPGRSNGTLEIHEPGVHRRTHQMHANVPLEVDPSDLEEATGWCTIPADMISYETLEYLGLSRAKAIEIWVGWRTSRSHPDSEIISSYEQLLNRFIAFVTTEMLGDEDTSSEDDEEWYRCLSNSGFSDVFQDAFMNPDSKHVRLTRPYKRWVTQSLSWRLEELLVFQRSSHEREIWLAANGTGGDQGGIESARAFERELWGLFGSDDD